MRLRTELVAAIAAVCLGLALPRAGHGQEAGAGHEAQLGVDATITGVAAVGVLLPMLIPVDTEERWRSEIFGSLDVRVRGNFSASAAKLSDSLVLLTVAGPALLQLGGGLDEAMGARMLLYAEAVSVGLFANSLAKYTVQRPRPYVYNEDPRVRAFVRATGKDAFTSFYSGHASTSFTAAVAGSYLYALGSGDERARALVWLVELGLATATANLRVRAGKHYYSDIVIGALAGAAVGVAVPALHAGDQGAYAPSSLEWGAMAGGVLVGALVSQLLPLESNILAPLDASERGAGSLALVPVVLDGGSGLALRGAL